MAEYYCDHGAYGLGTNRLGLDIPAWGIPQEGDGSSKDAATAASVASIVFNSVPTTGIITVCGVTISNSSVVGAASVTAAANALATNINATSTAVAAGVALGIPQLRNLVYARGPAGGAPAGTCQIMMRIGSTRLNYATNTSAVVATTYDGAPTLTQFAGGSGGCWGWFINPIALGVSNSISQFAYGAFLALPYVCIATPVLADNLYVRTGGGANKTITCSFTAAQYFSAANLSVSMIFDTNTKWTGDSPNGVIKVRFSATTGALNNSLRLCYPGANRTYIALAPGGFEIEYYCNQSQGTLGIYEGVGGSGVCSTYLKNIKFRDSMIGAGPGYGMLFTVTGSATLYVTRLWEACEFIVTTPRAVIWQALFSMGGFQSILDQTYIGCTFDFNISGVSDPGAILNNTHQYETDITFKGCYFKGFTNGYSLLTGAGGWPSNAARLNLVVDNCYGLKMPTSYLGLPSSTVFVRQSTHQIIFSNANLASQAGMRIEDCRGVAEWVPDDPIPFPYLSSTLPGAGVPYAIRLLWIRAVGFIQGRPYRSPDFRMFHQLVEATRTLTLRLFAPSSLASNMKVTFCYIDSNGVARMISTEEIDANGDEWANSSGYVGYSAKEMSVITPYAVKANSEITAFIQFVGNPPGAGAVVSIYVDPEFLVA